jgi:cyclopropane fatty-acyl-phospholipid synthase-like methyltransferase
MADNIDRTAKYQQALWKIYRRSQPAVPWKDGDTFPWNEPGFSERMLRLHLDQSSGAASRSNEERLAQIEWMWTNLELSPGGTLLDLTCGPGLYAVEFARRGLSVLGIDFSPASIEFARDFARNEGVAKHCCFLESDIRNADFGREKFDGAIFLYGQLAVFKPEECQELLTRICAAMRPGGVLLVEFLNDQRIDRQDSTWWFTDRSGLWGSEPFLHLGERYWDKDQQASIERYYILRLSDGRLDEITLCDQVYSADKLTQMMMSAGFGSVEVRPAWDGLPLYDADEWQVYLARR